MQATGGRDSVRKSAFPAQQVGNFAQNHDGAARPTNDDADEGSETLETSGDSVHNEMFKGHRPPESWANYISLLPLMCIVYVLL